MLAILSNSEIINFTFYLLRKRNEQNERRSEEQQGFRSGRSCTDAVFVIRQMTEKSIEYNKPAYMCLYVDLEKAFDRVELKDVTSIIHIYYITGEYLTT